ncbi:MAG: HAMP domain-containing sensor histidine kinase [Rubricoccaceae bacterium]|nr:HAMP domain-containing sensor histidine kinase [Rubricoccaceae bacterium]
MLRWKNVRDLFFPRRASTQTWMMLTFALFVGLAVVGVGLYSFIVLRGQVRDAARETLRDEAERVAVLLEEEVDPLALRTLAVQIAGVTERDLAVSRLVDGTWRPLLGPIDEAFFQQPEVAAARMGGVGYAEPGGALGDDGRMLYVALFRPPSGLMIRLGQPAPPLYRAVQKVQATLAVGMALSLLLALLGAWIASRQVVGPLRAITRSAHRINEGELDRRIHVRTRAAEFQDLARSLNQMAGRFRADIHELQRMQRVQNEFIGNVSHEVKNPIFAVFGYLEALGSDSLPRDQRHKYAQKGLANLTRLNVLFSDLIEIAKLEYREDLIRPERFDLQALIDEVCEILEPKAEEKGLGLLWENPALEVYADRNRIRQVLTNLVDNAVAYTDEGTVRCRMRRHRDKARVEVVDTGRGIPEEHLDRIFERFYRVDTARSRKMGGTGLGLSIVKQILQAHGETIHVESTKGRGTRFWFELPLAEAAEPLPEETPEEVAVTEPVPLG